MAVPASTAGRHGRSAALLAVGQLQPARSRKVPADAMRENDFHRLPPSVALDHEQELCRIGLLALDNDQVVESDMFGMLPKDARIGLHVAHVPLEDKCTLDSLSSPADRIADACATILPDERLDSVIFGCTSGTAVVGFNKVSQSVRASHPEAEAV